jgi:hypothetical protein
VHRVPRREHSIFRRELVLLRHPTALGTWCYFRFRLSDVAGFLPHPKLRHSSAIEPGNQHVREQEEGKYGQSSEKNRRYI